MSRQSANHETLKIAVLLDHLNFFGRGYEGQLRDALCARARESGIDLLLLYGGALEAPTALGAADNIIFHKLDPGEFDGIIVAAALISAYCGASGVARLVERYRPAKMCSIGVALPGVPSLLLDNRAGMTEAVEHLVRDHGRRQVAFLAGTPKNPEAEDRLAAYRSVLEKYGIAFDEARVASGQFLPALGRAAMDEILDRGGPFDAVASANDSMAIGAIQALRKRGLRVPEDVAIVGFDDLTLARLGNPPMTTVAQPFSVFAELAFACIEKQIAGISVPEVIPIPAQFIRRQSCGCGYHPAFQSDDTEKTAVGGGEGTLEEQIRKLVPKIAEMLVTGYDDGNAVASRLGEGLLAQVSGHKDAFQRAVSAVLVGVAEDDERHRGLQSAINCLRNQLQDRGDINLERALYDGFSLVAMSHTAAQVRHRLDLDEGYLRLLNVGEQASLAFDMASLRDSLMRGLPAAGVRTAIVSRAVDPSAKQLEPVVCYVDNALKDPSPAAFPTGFLVPKEVLQARRASTLLVFPMVCETGLLGVVAFDHLDGNNAYIAFRNQIAAVLKSLRLHEEVLRKRIEALSVLAGGVAHDLNNALGPLMIIPDIILDQLSSLAIDPKIFSELREDAESIKTACQRAAQTIKDLLTLGRQGRSTKSSLELNRLVKSCLMDGRLLAAVAGANRIELHVDLSREPLGVLGVESQLARAISNLVRNAIDASSQAGDISVRTAQVLLDRPAVGFETIPPGKYAVLTVADQGCGIAPEDVGRIFEPFFSRKRPGENSGTGLGLAIVQGVVREHQGFIDVASTPQVGTTFKVYLPMVEASRPSLPPSQVPVMHKKARILVVDDEETQLRTCRRVLGLFGYTVEAESSGEKAIEWFRQAQASAKSPFDLVIVDMLLGGTLEGWPLIQQIRALFPSQKVVIASGHAPNQLAGEAAKLGLLWLAKPYSLDALVAAVNANLPEDPEAGGSKR